MAASISAEEARQKVLEDDDELENMDLDTESEETEGDAFKNNNFFSRNAQTIPTKTWNGPCKWRIFCQCKYGNFGSAVRLDSKPRSRDNKGRLSFK